MELATLMNGITAIDAAAFQARWDGRDDAEQLGRAASDGLIAEGQLPWFGSPVFTAYVYGTLLGQAVHRLGRRVTLTELVRGVLLHIAVRGAGCDNVTLLVGAPRPADFAFLDGTAGRFAFCPHPEGARVAAPVAPIGNLFFDFRPHELWTVLGKATVGTLFFDMDEDPDLHLDLLRQLSALLAPGSALVAGGPSDRLHALYTTLEPTGAAKLWAQVVVCDDPLMAAQSFAFFETLDVSRLERKAEAAVEPTVPVSRLDSPVVGIMGPLHECEPQGMATLADRVVRFAPPRLLPSRQPAFVDLLPGSEERWTQRLGIDATTWFRPTELLCPSLACSSFSRVVALGRGLITTQAGAVLSGDRSTWQSAPPAQLDHRVSEPTIVVTAEQTGTDSALLDVIARLWFLRFPDWTGRSVTIDSLAGPRLRHLLHEVAEVAPERIRTLPPGAACLLDNALIPPPMVADDWLMPEAVATLRSSLAMAERPRDAALASARLIHVAQPGVGPVNDKALAEALAELGFISLDPASMAFNERVGLFRDAAVVVAPSRGAVADVMFCSPDARVVLLQRDLDRRRSLGLAMQLLQLDYGYAFGETFDCIRRREPAEWLVDVQAVVKRVRSLL